LVLVLPVVLTLLALRSFPTRRSSDLVIAAMLVFSALPTVAKHPPWLFCLLAISLLLLAVGLTTKSAVSVCACTLTALTALAWTADRKSTRLNSSHVKISYAVFCLKKK